MTPTTEQLKDLLAKVTQGGWYIDGGQVTSDTLPEMDCIVDYVYSPDANATLIALAPTLAAEVVRLREALALCRDEIDDYIRQEYPLDHPVHDRYRQRDFDANPARQALDSSSDE